jgi:hypothetical protein
VAIENRINPALQRQFMPARYWTHLTEMDGEWTGNCGNSLNWRTKIRIMAQLREMP